MILISQWHFFDDIQISSRGMSRAGSAERQMCPLGPHEHSLPTLPCASRQCSKVTAFDCKMKAKTTVCEEKVKIKGHGFTIALRSITFMLVVQL